MLTIKKMFRPISTSWALDKCRTEYYARNLLIFTRDDQNISDLITDSIPHPHPNRNVEKYNMSHMWDNVLTGTHFQN